MVATRHSTLSLTIVPPAATRADDMFVAATRPRSHLALAHLAPPSPVSPMGPHSVPTTPVDGCGLDPALGEPESDDCWNLIPYNIPWGPDYYEYRAGTLPGPDGKACLFLRSPTPLKNRRTEKACNKCRERKAKCSGDQPACARCVSRGYICTYVQDTKRPKGPTLARQRRREDISPSTSPTASTSDAWSTDSSSGFGSPSSSYSRALSPKPKCEEADDYAFLARYASPPKHELEAEHWALHERANHLQWEESAAAYAYAGALQPDILELPPYAAYEPFHADVLPEHTAPIMIPQASPSLHAPRPVKCAPLVHLLSPVVAEPDNGLELMMDEPPVSHVYADPVMDMVMDAPWDGSSFDYAEPIEYVDMLDGLHYPEEAVFAEPHHTYYEALAQQQYEASCAGIYSHPPFEAQPFYGAYSSVPV